MKEQVVEWKPDGSSLLTTQALWDSSVHDSILLNKVTAAHNRVLIQLEWFVDVETCSDPVRFSMDAAVSIQSRDARPPSRFFSFIGSSKILPKMSTVFSVKLSPPLTRSPQELWRLDTSEKYVRGEETLGAWKPRGISVVEDYEKLVTMERRSADVQAIRVLLNAMGSRAPSQSDSLIWKADDLVKKSLELWQKQFGHKGQVRISVTPF